MAPFLADWAQGVTTGAWLAVVVDDDLGRPVASALAVPGAVPPAPGREQGRTAHIGSVATEVVWRGRGCARATVAALVSAIDGAGVESTTLTATADGEALYASLGFMASGGVAMRRSGPQSGPDAAL